MIMVPSRDGSGRAKIIALAMVVLLASAMVAVMILKWPWLEVFSVGEDSWEHYRRGGLFSNASPSLSVNGTDLLYASPCSGNGDIYLLNLSTGKIRQLTSDFAYESSPVIAPDGKTIAFVRERRGCRHIWLMDGDGLRQAQLTSGAVLDDVHAFSADGQYVMFSRSIVGIGRGRRTLMYVADVQRAGNVQKIGQEATFVPGMPAVVYVPADGEEIWYRSLEDPSRDQQLNCRGRLPSLSPDLRHLLVARPQKSTWSLDRDLWVRDLETGQESFLGSGHAACFFSNGDRVVYYVGYACKIVVATIDGTERLHVNTVGGYKTAPRYDPTTGDVIFGHYRGGNAVDQFYRLDADEFTMSRIATVTCELENERE